MNKAQTARQRAEKRGRRGEQLATWLLRLKGYRVSAARHRIKGGEVDLVATKGDTLVLVEVKWRKTLADAVAAVTMQQQRRIETVARALLGHAAPNTSVRFDVIALAPGRFPRHIKGAWRPTH